ncbi:MAG TPA: N-formylglutamate amidohydrolase [Casimicrobiaceae bacterium]|nr:N-formylglutamate amidohydrolase [Casimicrobiaceae bacterium]
MSEAFIRHDPAGDAIPLVLDSPHSGDRYPKDFDHAPPRAIVRQAEDTHVATLWRAAPAYGATLLEARFPRSYIDPNRSLSDIDPELLADGWPIPLEPTRKTRQGIGLVWRVARDGMPLYARKLRREEIEMRIDRFWRPYHDELSALLDARLGRFGAVWHLDCHSMPAVGDALADDPGRERADFVLGDRDGTTCDGEFTALVADTLRRMGYSVAINDPYKGVELVRRHGRPAENRHSLQVEVKRTLYMDEQTLEPNARFLRLEADLSRLTATIARHIRERLGLAAAPSVDDGRDPTGQTT